MTPWVNISIGGIVVGGNFMDRLVSVTLTDAAGHENDRLEFEIDDREPFVSVPAKKTKVSCSMGYAASDGAEPAYSGIKQFMGIFIVDETKFSTPPNRLNITCHGFDTGDKLKATVDKDWHDKTIGQIVTEIAGKHNLAPAISKELASKKIAHIDQINQSDMDFLSRLAGKNGALFKVAEDKLIFAKKGETASVSGKATPIILITRHECSTYNGLIQSRSDYEGVEARYHNKDTGKQEKVKSKGAGEKLRAIPTQFPTKEEAQEAADGKDKELSKETETLSLTCVGNPLIMAESTVLLSGFRPGIRTLWKAQRVVHKLSSGGYTTDVELELPDKDAKGSGVSGRD